MRKFLTLMLACFGLTLIVSSCATSTGAHCDAYGSVETVPVNDVA